MSTRREILRAGAVTGLAALLPATVVELLATPAAAAPVPSGAGVLARSTFLPHLGDHFLVEGGGRLRLAEVNDLPCAESEGLRDHEHCFALRFSGPALTQDTYTVSHSRLGRFPLFLVPMGAAGTSVAHEAVFNRHVPA